MSTVRRLKLLGKGVREKEVLVTAPWEVSMAVSNVLSELDLSEMGNITWFFSGW